MSSDATDVRIGLALVALLTIPVLSEILHCPVLAFEALSEILHCPCWQSVHLQKNSIADFKYFKDMSYGNTAIFIQMCRFLKNDIADL